MRTHPEERPRKFAYGGVRVKAALERVGIRVQGRYRMIAYSTCACAGAEEAGSEEPVKAAERETVVALERLVNDLDIQGLQA